MADDQQDIDFSHSNTDLMASIAVIFLLLAVAMILANSQSLTSIKEDEARLNNARNQLEHDILDILQLKKGDRAISADGCIKVKSDAVRSEIRISFTDGSSSKGERCKGLTFEPARYDLPQLAETNAILSQLALIAGKTCQMNVQHASLHGRPPVWRISIEGHTDDDRYFNDEMSGCTDKTEVLCGNLYLSAQRARSVFLGIDRRFSANREKKACFEDLVLISGRGPLDPITDNSANRETASEIGVTNKKQQNRRVEYIIHFETPKLETKRE